MAGALFEDTHLRGAACLHALNEPEARAIRAYGLRNPICVLPNGVDLPRDKGQVPAAWAHAVGEGRKTLLFLGRLHPKKGLVNLVRAWNGVQRDGAARDWALVIAGWDQGRHERELKSLAQELGLGRSVCFAGPQFNRDKAATFASADAFVLPSLSEGLPMAVLEAWSYGLPVIMTPQCNLPEGLAADAALRIGSSPADIADGLRRLFAMAEGDRREMGKRGRRLVEERFAWPCIAEEMKAVYEWVLGGGPAPACVVSD
jgi:poly(glycerol-phosphate) alpha-glucosyltransferase